MGRRKNPETLDEWRVYIARLSDARLEVEAKIACTRRFVDVMADEGTPPDVVAGIILSFVAELEQRGLPEPPTLIVAALLADLPPVELGDGVPVKRPADKPIEVVMRGPGDAYGWADVSTWREAFDYAVEMLDEHGWTPSGKRPATASRQETVLARLGTALEGTAFRLEITTQRGITYVLPGPNWDRTFGTN